MNDFDDFMTSSVSVQTFQGATGTGSRYATAVTKMVMVDEGRRLVRDADGEQVVSEATLYDANLDNESVYLPGSKVTLPSGRSAYVIMLKKHQMPSTEMPATLEVVLT